MATGLILTYLQAAGEPIEEPHLEQRTLPGAEERAEDGIRIHDPHLGKVPAIIDTSGLSMAEATAL